MSPHSVNNFVTDLVQMAQAVERLPVVEAELNDANNVINTMTNQLDAIRSDLDQAKSYASSLEQKVRDAEVAKDQAETMFLELDEKVGQVLALRANTADLVNNIFDKLTPPPQPEPAPIVSEVKPIKDTEAEAKANEPYGWPPAAPDSPALVGAEHFDDGGLSHPTQEHTDTSLAAPMPAPEQPKPQPYAGKRYVDYFSFYIPLDKWIEGGGTDRDYLY